MTQSSSLQGSYQPAPEPETDTNLFLQNLINIVGQPHVLTKPAATRPFRKGFRFGDGPVVAVIRPGSLVEQWHVLQACVAAHMIVIMQSANTGLTGGSTPDGDSYDRGVVIINTTRIAGIHLINEGKQVVCLPGARLYELEEMLQPLGREPHSVIGSSCIGASVFGGVCNNSGGALVQRGPAFTQLALYARLDENGQLQLVNHLGIRLQGSAEDILAQVEQGGFSDEVIENDPTLSASDHNYSTHVRDVDAPTPARFNADPTRLFEASGSAGKVMLLAVRLDTFAKDKQTAVFYVGSNDPQELEDIRRHMLSTFSSLPVSGEYVHRDAFNLAAIYGKDTFLAVQYLGTARLPKFFKAKASFDAFAERFPFLPKNLSDKVIQAASHLLPQHLPKRMLDFRNRFEHHLIIKMGEGGIDEAKAYFTSHFPSSSGDYFECTAEEGSKAFLHRFAVASAANRYRAIHTKDVEDILALDIALRRDDQAWVETLPEEIEKPILNKIYYGHFFCHVFHQEYIVSKGHNCMEIEEKMWALLDARGAEYPAEHNVGHLYHAKPALAAHYKALDPTNSFNPGIGRTSKRLNWQPDNGGAGCDCHFMFK